MFNVYEINIGLDFTTNLWLSHFYQLSWCLLGSQSVYCIAAERVLFLQTSPHLLMPTVLKSSVSIWNWGLHPLAGLYSEEKGLAGFVKEPAGVGVSKRRSEGRKQLSRITDFLASKGGILCFCFSSSVFRFFSWRGCHPVSYAQKLLKLPVKCHTTQLKNISYSQHVTTFFPLIS